MTAKTKLILKNCTRLVSFILILLLLLYGVSFLLEPKNNDDAAGFVNPNASGYLSLEKDTLDVFIVGNSDAYSGFSPMEMWKNYGFTSYISGTGKQLIGESVRAVEQCLKTQKPKVVILETDQLYTNSNSVQVIARDARKQILNQFSNFFFCFVAARNVSKGRFDLIFRQHARFALTKRHGTFATAALHLTHEEDPDTNQQQHREPGDEDRSQQAWFFRRFTDNLDVLGQQVIQ